MPSIYHSAFQSFFRQGFAKSFTHGYAQSVVAATHPHVLNPQNRPSFSRRNNSRFGRISGLGLQAAFHNSSSSASPTGPVEGRHAKIAGHGGLDAYYEHLQKSQEATEEEEQEWVQYQFPKRIEWKPSPPSAPAAEQVDTAAVDSGKSGDGEISIQNDGDFGIPREVQVASAHVDAASQQETQAGSQRKVHDESISHHSTTPFSEQELGTCTGTPVLSTTVARTATPTLDSHSQTYVNHLTKLAEASRYAEIPAVFEAMLAGGVTPTPTAYNALLMAAIHLPVEKLERQSRALDVYADMRRRKVSPDSETYNILVGLLASRSLEVSTLKKKLEEKRLRFGGMDEPGKFMLSSHELDLAILGEDDRLGMAMQLFDSSVTSGKAAYSAETYHQLISACAQSGRTTDMLRIFGHMESTSVAPLASTFRSIIGAFAKSGDLISAVECYNEYRSLAIKYDAGQATLKDRLDAEVYAAVINAYVLCDKLQGATKFYERILGAHGIGAVDFRDAIMRGFTQAFIKRGNYQDALGWARCMGSESRCVAMSELAVVAADHDDKDTAVAAFSNAGPVVDDRPVIALLAMSIRQGDVTAATSYWEILCRPGLPASTSYVEPTAMYAVAMVGRGLVAEGLAASEHMFRHIRDAVPQAADEIDEGIEFIARYMQSRGAVDPRQVASQPVAASSYPSTPTAVGYEDTFDPYAHSTDFKGSSMISDELDGAHGRKGPKLNATLTRFRNIRRAGRHPRYMTYAKLISAAARESRMDLCHEILNMARVDVPLLPHYPVVCHGWSSILDAMIGACLNLGHRSSAERYHEELLGMGSAPSANTYGLYITTLKESTKTFDEASEAVHIFLRAKAEGVEPSSFLYNALIGKLGKARRIDDCLFYFAEMRALGIKPTSVTYGTVVNALCRVSDEMYAEELFDEMEAMPKYKARPAPYNSMMQFFLTTKRNKAKVLEYHERMQANGIAPTAHTYKLLIDSHATLEPIDMAAAESVLEAIRTSGQQPQPVHYASLIHAQGCNLHDLSGARRTFDAVMKDPIVAPNACLFQALFEAMVANHRVADTEPILAVMRRKRVELTPYIANTLIHGWATEKNTRRCQEIYSALGRENREPSTYEAMTRAYLAVEEREKANSVVSEMVGRGYPSAVVNKVIELLDGGSAVEKAVATA